MATYSIHIDEQQRLLLLASLKAFDDSDLQAELVAMLEYMPNVNEPGLVHDFTA